MSTFHFEAVVRLKYGLLDPQGKAIEESLPHMGWTNVSNVRVGKHIEFDVQADDVEEAARIAGKIGNRLLANPVIETVDYTYRSEPSDSIELGMGSSAKVEIEVER